jgi:hypothetical protein
MGFSKGAPMAHWGARITRNGHQPLPATGISTEKLFWQFRIEIPKDLVIS